MVAEGMAEGVANPVWQVLGSSVRGASHVRAGLPNQDAIGWTQIGGQWRSLIVAVSDGHGSPRCFRSHVGSRLAIETALAVSLEFLNGQPDLKSLTAVKRTAEERLPREMARRWREAVEDHVGKNPLSEEELSALESTDGAPAREAVAARPVRAYGATVLTAVVEESFIIYVQLGDGDILLVSGAGEVIRPMANDERLFANETTSLSSREAWRDFRFGFQALAGSPPALILLSTDGYANSFVNEEAFLQVGNDLLAMLRADGVESVGRNLETWLAQATAAGSGDDTTLAIICDLNALSKTESKTDAEPPAVDEGEPQ